MKREAKPFGDGWAHCYWDKKRFVLDRGFSSSEMTLNRKDARGLLSALNRFLGIKKVT